jgi:hypothetical protein
MFITSIGGLCLSSEAFATSPVVITTTIEDRAITAGENLVVSAMIRNTGNVSASQLNVQLISGELTIESEKQWPGIIYPNSSIGGSYVLRGRDAGTYPIYLSATFLVNNTSPGTPIRSLEQGFSEHEAGVVYVQSAFPSWSSTVETGAFTILGALAGVLATKLADLWNITRTERKERAAAIKKIKGYLMSWLESNKKKVDLNESGEFGPYDNALSQGVYNFIAENDDLRKNIHDLYARLWSHTHRTENYVNMSPQEKQTHDNERGALNKDIDATVGILDKWKEE